VLPLAGREAFPADNYGSSDVSARVGGAIVRQLSASVHPESVTATSPCQNWLYRTAVARLYWWFIELQIQWEYLPDSQGLLMSQTGVITSQIQLPRAVAAWVLSAHAYALLIPLLLLPVLAGNSEFVWLKADYPVMFYVAIGLMMAGSAFEIAQNTFDNWYLTADVASANGSSLCDMLFFWFVIASQTAILIACKGSLLWLSIPAVVITLVYPWFYLNKRFAFVPLALVGSVASAVTWWAFGEPVLLLQLLLPAVTMFFFGLLLKTGNQVLHGFTTMAASSGVVILCWGIQRGGAVASDGWLVFIGALIVAAVVLGGTRRMLASLPATPRP